MSQLAQLSDAEIEARFYVVSRTAIQFLLAGFARTHDAFSVQFGGGEDFFLTTPLAVLPETGRMIIDCSGSPEINRRFLGSARNTFVGRPGGIHVQFSTGLATEVVFEGGKAFSVALPERVMRLQRREYFRVETLRQRPLEVLVNLSGGGSQKLLAHDLSVSGIGLNVASLPAGLEVGMSLDHCHFSLPDEGHPLFFDAILRHLTEYEARAGVHQWRLGLEFKALAANDNRSVQRYIAHVEHDRHELA